MKHPVYGVVGLEVNSDQAENAAEAHADHHHHGDRESGAVAVRLRNVVGLRGGR